MLDYFEYILYVLTVLAWSIDRYRTRKKSKGDPRTFEKAYAIDSKVYTVLWSLLVELEAERVYITQFHNGDHFYSGQSIQKHSISHEVPKPGLSSIRRNYTNIPISYRMHELIKTLKREGMQGIPDRDALPDSFQHIREYMLLYSIRSLYEYHITDAEGRTIGILSLHFTAPGALDNVEHLKIENYLSQIRNILSR